jgi:hypothetical protein
MSRVAICPRCTSHLGLPADVSLAAQVQCPICEVEFSLATVAPRELPQARIVEREAAGPAADESPQLTPQERLSQLIRATAATAPQASPDAELTEAYDDAYQDADPELAVSEPPRDPLQLGSSRLDQLLSDLIKTPGPAPAAAPPPNQASATSIAPKLFTETPPGRFEEASPEPIQDAHLEKEFAAVLDDEPEYASSDDELVQREDEPEGVPAFGDQSAGEELPSELRTAPRRKRHPSIARTMIGVIGGGALGILLGAYGLLWLRGPESDILGLSQILPASMLPASTAPADDDAAYVDDQNKESGDIANPDSSVAAIEQPPVKFDPAVSPATAEEPIADARTEAAVGDVVSSTPDTPKPTLAEPPAERQTWPTTPIVGDLKGVKLYTVAELDELIPAADKAHREFLAGDLSQEASWSMMGPAYMTLASLAERYTLVDPVAYGNDLIAKQLESKEIFRALVGDPARRADLATVAARWLQHERRLNQGVILIGRVRDLRPQGKWTEYIVDVPLGDSTVEALVLMDQIRFSAGDEIAVVGAILPRPKEQLTGYEGSAAQRVVAGWAFTPEDFKAPPASADAGQLPFETGAGGL